MSTTKRTRKATYNFTVAKAINKYLSLIGGWGSKITFLPNKDKHYVDIIGPSKYIKRIGCFAEGYLRGIEDRSSGVVKDDEPEEWYKAWFDTLSCRK